MVSTFDGFPEAAFRFLKQLTRNNDREWFRIRKTEYRELVERPMESLILAVADGCRVQGLPLYAKEKNPVMRVYRDVRFSKDKSPLKTHVAAELRRSFRNSRVMLYLHLSPAERLVAAGVWQPERALLQAWREEITKNPERFETIAAALEKGGVPLRPEYSLSGIPRGFQNYAGQPIESWLKLTSFIVRKDLEFEECTSCRLVDVVLKFAITVRPLLEFGWRVEDQQAKRASKGTMEFPFEGYRRTSTSQ